MPIRAKTRRGRVVESGSGMSGMSGGSAMAAGADLNSHHGAYALSPLKLLITIAVSALFFLGASVFQVTGTEQAVLHSLLSNVSVTPVMILQQFKDVLAGKLDFAQGVAFAIGLGVQFTLFMIAFPASSAYAVLYRFYNPVAVGSDMQEGAARIKKIQDMATFVIVGADLATDLFYVTQNESFMNHGHQVFSFVLWVIPWPNLDGANAGILFIGILYAALLCYVNVVSVKLLVAYIEVIFLKIRGHA